MHFVQQKHVTDYMMMQLNRLMKNMRNDAKNFCNPRPAIQRITDNTDKYFTNQYLNNMKKVRKILFGKTADKTTKVLTAIIAVWLLIIIEMPRLAAHYVNNNKI